MLFENSMIGYSFEHKGRVWSAIWLDTDSRLTHDDRAEILIEVADCYVEKDRKRSIKGERYEGTVFAKEYFQSIEGICGRRFDIELETDTRRSKLSGLVSEFVNAGLN